MFDLFDAERATHPRTRTAVLIVFLLEGTILTAEAILVLLSGRAIVRVFMYLAIPEDLPSLIGMSLAYMLLITCGGAYAKPPDNPRLSKGLLMLSVVFTAALLLSEHPFRTLPWLFLWFGVVGCAIGILRRATMAFARYLPVQVWPSYPTAFIGNSETAARLLQQIESDPRKRLRAVGFFDDRTGRQGPLTDKLAHLGSIENLVSYIHGADLSHVFMALPWSAGERISTLIEQLRFLPLTVHLIPDHLPPMLLQRPMSELDDIVMPTLMVPPFSPLGAAAKRAVDLLVASILLIVLSPVFIFVAAAIRIDSKGPIFFRQRRIGQFGRSFEIFKFRSLHAKLTDSAAESLVGKGDVRVTRAGKWLRKYSIDELPQIINVLFGNMSLVGPRPHAPRAKANQRIYAEVMPEYMLRYRVKPGITGWAQINGWRGNTDTEEKLRKRVQFDFAYINSWSMLNDLKILALTVPSALFPPLDNH